jgi:hypothetical protein
MSAEAAPVERSDIPPAVRELAGDLLPDAPRLAREMNEHLFATMQELRGRRQRRCLLGAYAPPEAAALADYVPPEEILGPRSCSAGA